jgi:hypothetical protein
MQAGRELAAKAPSLHQKFREQIGAVEGVGTLPSYLRYAAGTAQDLPFWKGFGQRPIQATWQSLFAPRIIPGLHRPVYADRRAAPRVLDKTRHFAGRVGDAVGTGLTLASGGIAAQTLYDFYQDPANELLHAVRQSGFRPPPWTFDPEKKKIINDRRNELATAVLRDRLGFGNDPTGLTSLVSRGAGQRLYRGVRNFPKTYPGLAASRYFYNWKSPLGILQNAVTDSIAKYAPTDEDFIREIREKFPMAAVKAYTDPSVQGPNAPVVPETFRNLINSIVRDVPGSARRNVLVRLGPSTRRNVPALERGGLGSVNVHELPNVARELQRDVDVDRRAMETRRNPTETAPSPYRRGGWSNFPKTPEG